MMLSPVMLSLLSLWLPILISAVVVFVASSVVHMVLKYHANDFHAVPAEHEVMEALRRFGIPPGEYMMPRAGSMADMKSPAFQEKLARGPVALLTVIKNGPFEMGPRLLHWFIYCLFMSVFAAYITNLAVGPGTEYRVVFRIASCAAFMCYGLALWQNTIWYNRSWVTTLKSTIDALIYGFLTGGVFGWLWPS
jgi:hypothetical protein